MAIAVIAAVAGVVCALAVLGLPNRLVASFQVVHQLSQLSWCLPSSTLKGASKLQHNANWTSLRALAGADEALMMLEEAPQEVLLHLEAEHRHLHSD